MALTKQQFKKLQVGDLIENHMLYYDLDWDGDLGIITQSQTFRNPNPNSQIRKFHQVSIKWSKFDKTCEYDDCDFRTLKSLTRIAEAKK